MTTPQPAGSADVFDQIVLVADARLGTDAVSDIVRASLISGAACARSMVTRVPDFSEHWSEENQVGAALLTEFWSAVIAARMLGRVEDRDDVVDALSAQFAGDLFGSSVSALGWSLRMFEEQLATGIEFDADGGTTSIGAMTWYFLYWRSRDLLLGDLPLQGRYHPALNLEAWQRDIRHSEIDPPLDEEGATLARDVLLWGMDIASQHFAALREAAQADAEGSTEG